MTKLNMITIRADYGILKVQEVQLSEDKNGLIEIKGTVGSGKSSFAKTAEIGLGASKAITNKILIGKKIDIEEQITYGETKIYIRTRKSENSAEFKTSIYCKDAANRKMTPVINGKAPTAAQLQSILRTELTFGTDKFLSENPRVNFEFMQEVYHEQLYDVGIVFDKKDEAYAGSILDRLELSKVHRSNAFEVKRKLVGFKDTLEDEGHYEDNIPKFIDEEEIKTKIQELTHGIMSLRVTITKENSDNSEKYTADLLTATEARSTKLVNLRMEYQNLINEVKNYNSKILADYNNAVRRLDEKDEKLSNANSRFISIKESIRTAIPELTSMGVKTKLLSDWVDSSGLDIGDYCYDVELKKIIKLVAIELDEKGRVINEDPLLLSGEAGDIVTKMDSVIIKRSKIKEVEINKPIVLNYERPDLVNYDGKNKHCLELAKLYLSVDSLNDDIENSKETNNIFRRWESFFNHKEADKKVREIWAEYKMKFAELDLGVDGLRMMVVGNEDKQEIRTMYNGVHNPGLFHNPKGEFRFIVGNDGYSHTQQAIIAVLMQIYLLERKRDKGDEGLRHMWLTCPLDKKTRDMLIEIQKKYDMKFICETTGDFESSDLEDGSFLIEDGYLLTNIKTT